MKKESTDCLGDNIVNIDLKLTLMWKQGFDGIVFIQSNVIR